MEIETAFLLGVLVGHWILLCAIWRAVSKLVVMITEQETEATNSARREIIEYQPSDDLRRPKF